jgi:hypothetical protein
MISCDSVCIHLSTILQMQHHIIIYILCSLLFIHMVYNVHVIIFYLNHMTTVVYNNCTCFCVLSHSSNILLTHLNNVNFLSSLLSPICHCWMDFCATYYILMLLTYHFRLLFRKALLFYRIMWMEVFVSVLTNSLLMN